MQQHGYVHIYTGNGKGKTTAALGLALRAAGAGLKVHIIQFIKGMRYNELIALERLGDNITVEQYGRGCFITREPSPKDIAAARTGLEAAGRALREGAEDVVILDEAAVAVDLGLFSTEELIRILDGRAPGVETVVTGRGAPKELLEYADLVTEMRCVKHYYEKGVAARDGIER